MNTNYKEHEVIIKGQYDLKGTLTLPEGTEEKVPVALIIHGSGPLDRDGNAKGMPLGIYKAIADILNERGIATLRYDKRGCGESEGNYLEAGFWDLIDDAEAALNFLKSHPRVDEDKVILLGHSEGTIIAPVIENRQPVMGVILLAGAAESIGSTVDRQFADAMNALDKETGFKAFLIRLLKLKNKLEKQNKKLWKRILESDEAVIRAQGRKLNAKWMREHYHFNVLEALEKVTSPTLVLVGDKDVQVVPEQSKVIAETIKGPAEYHIIEDMNHILKKDPVSKREITDVRKYKKMVDVPLDEDLVHYVEDWLKSLLSESITIN